jgi:hypothetical protein
MLRIILVLLVLGYYALHQDIWFWRTAQPVVFGVLPIGLFYHAAYTAAISLLMWVLVRLVWPGHLDDDDDPETSGRSGVQAASSPGSSAKGASR